ncbi:small ribosomal subunit protein mS25-like [Corticium candelabrum]|uniref:small ribosomal subunit protein mS25-like n=1 Tax=Corticium candelabrum TaxID=121492 RepID=UPI002E259AAD|nr:small ribosomal subunit protein mS25-like [Corticium candelabrum]
MSRFGFARTIAHLEQCKLVLRHDVKSLVVRLQSHGQENTGTRLFIAENVPQLRYRNPNISISLERKFVNESEVVVNLVDGRKDVLKTANLMNDEIMAKLDLQYSMNSDELKDEQ